MGTFLFDRKKTLSRQFYNMLIESSFFNGRFPIKSEFFVITSLGRCCVEPRANSNKAE